MDLLQCVHVSPLLGSPALDTICRCVSPVVSREEESAPPACWHYSILVSTMGPMVLLCQAVFQLVGTQSILAHGVVLWQMQGFLLLCTEFYEIPVNEIPVNPFFHTVEVPLNGSTTLLCINHLFQFCITWKPPEGTQPSHLFNSAGVKQHLCQCQPHVTPLETDLWPGCC